MKKVKKIPNKVWIFGIILIGIIGSFGTEAVASELPRGMVIGDEEGFKVEQDGKYFIDIPDVKPGAVYTKEITLRSTDEKEPFDLGIRVHPKEAKGTINWNEHVVMTLKLDGKEIYQGPLLGNGERDWTKEDLSLGTFKFGSDKVIEAVFEISSELTNEDFKEKSTFLFEWEFIATRNKKPIDSSNEPDDKKTFFKLPKTGEEWRELLYQLLAGLLLVMVALLLWKKRQQERGEE